MKYLIIGNGVAGIEAAVQIRANEKDAEIVVFSREPYPFYYRPKLVEYIAEEMPVEKLFFYKNEFFEQKQIQQLIGVSVSKITVSDKAVTDSTGEIHNYDKLLIATGGAPRIPSPLTPDSVFVLRSIEDAKKIKSCACSSLSVVVAGAGLLGLETAFSLKNAGRDVTVVETMSYLLPRQLDEQGGRFLQRQLESKGMKFIFSDNIDQYSEGKLHLKSGISMNADGLIVSAGIVPDISIAAAAGIATSRGIIIDQNMQTNIKDIYAAGDCAEFKGALGGLWPVAKEQGKFAGDNMCGNGVDYHGTLHSAALKITGIDLFSGGDVFNTEADIFVKENENRYIKLFHREGSATGGIVIGDPVAVKDMRSVLALKMSTQDFIAKNS